MSVSVIVASFGDDSWLSLAMNRAVPSVAKQTKNVFVRHDEDGPIEEVRNRAALQVDGRWLVFLDADDELAPGYIDAIERRTRRGSKLRLLAPYVQFDNETPVIPSAGHTMPPLNHCVVGTAIHRDVFMQAGGFRASYWPWSDYELWLRAARLGAKVEFVPEAVYRVHVNPRSDNHVLTVREGAVLGRRIHREHQVAGGRWPIEGGERHG